MTMLTRDYLLALIEDASACRMTALIEPAKQLIEAVGDRPLLELSSWDIAAPLAKLGFDVDEYRQHIRDWDPSYTPGVDAPWGHEVPITRSPIRTCCRPSEPGS